MALFPSLTKRDKGLGELDSFSLSSDEGSRALGYIAGTAPLPSAKLSFSASFSGAGSPAQAAGDLSFEIDFAAESSAASAVATTGSFSMSASLTAAAAVVEEGAASLSASFALTGTSPATSISSVSDLFVKEHKQFGAFSPDVTFTDEDPGLKTDSTTSGLGYGYVFFTVQREDLRDRKLYIDWDITSSFGSFYHEIRLYEGALDRTSSTDFPSGSTIPNTQATGSPFIDRQGANGTGLTDEADFTDTMLDSIADGLVTVAIALGDHWNSESGDHTINQLEIREVSDSSVAHEFDMVNGNLTMESTGGLDDYGVFDVSAFPVVPLVSFDVDKEPTQSDGTTAPALTNQEGTGTLTVTNTPEYRTSVFPNGQPSVYYENGERHSSDGNIPDMTSSGGFSFQIAIHVETTTGRLLFGFTSNLGSSSWATWAAGGGFLVNSFPGDPVYLHGDPSPGLDAGLSNAITSNQSYVFTYKQDGSGNYRIKLNNTTVTGSDSPVASVSSSEDLFIGDWPAVIAPNMHVGQYHYWSTELSDADQDDIHDITMDILGIT